jgi:succinate dehydrogenase flavin-adding protein (antitoxin of CptAB toxin-antitoxin module)
MLKILSAFNLPAIIGFLLKKLFQNYSDDIVSGFKRLLSKIDRERIQWIVNQLLNVVKNQQKGQKGG